MNQMVRNLMFCLLLMVPGRPVVYSQSLTSPRHDSSNATETSRKVFQHGQDGSLFEEFSFAIKDFKVEHQSEHNNLNISISFRYVTGIANSDYPDYRLLAKDVEMFLTNYPNEKDYWEIVNKNLTSMLLKKYSALAGITCELTVDPVPNSPYVRSSRVIRERRK
ncbi:MAG: hypothetical protein C5B55_09270 [Blastocatellia bacterium]|nr:MAG: hypothetical protein C5B55_09270 [Blastocatellia bacterium]